MQHLQYLCIEVRLVVKKFLRKVKTPIKTKYFIKSFDFESISILIFFLSKSNASGKIVKNPTTNLAELNVKGPILSIPVSCAIKAVPQIKVVTSAQIIERDFVILLN